MQHISFVPTDLRVNLCRGDYCVCDRRVPMFSWAAFHSEKNQSQSAYRLIVDVDGRTLWDSDWVESESQRAVYAGQPLHNNDKATWQLTIKDKNGRESKTAHGSFIVSLSEAFDAPWLVSPDYQQGNTYCFIKPFKISKPLKRAVLTYCGLGLCHAYLNENKTNDSLYAPVFSCYNKEAYYLVDELDVNQIKQENHLAFLLGDGWRNNLGNWSIELQRRHPIDLFGESVLSAKLDLYYEDETSECIQTDESWAVIEAPWSSNLFIGERLDEARLLQLRRAMNLNELSFVNARITNKPCERLLTQTIPCEKEQKIYKPIAILPHPDGGFVVDFGKNISGVCRVLIPAGTPTGSEIVMRHGEMLNPDMTLYTDNLREARSEDCCITGDCDTDRIWQPRFTIHGFRYMHITGLDYVDTSTVFAVLVYSAIDKESGFLCSNHTVNAIYDAIRLTERDNIHGIFSDCPQRNERLGWMNDATVRFEAVPYQFDTTQIFPKIVADVASEQSEDGAITCTAPFFYGQRPADPVCSAPLVAIYENWMHYNDEATVRKYYPNMKAWNMYLHEHSENGVIDYSYYGDWAGPADSCVSMEDARSCVTPGSLMSSGYHYYNCRVLEKLAELLGLEDDIKVHSEMAEQTRQSILRKWFDPETAVVGTGSQGCQAFALWLGILPKEKREMAAERMNRSVVENHYRLTTGNLNTRYLFEMLTEYGYVETAWKLITREEYPSLGFMLQHEGTTIWERFEDKRTPRMNSHNHPMYGAVGVWFYRHIAGITPTKPGFESFCVNPYYPDGLHFASASVDTDKGVVFVKWVREKESIRLSVQVPFGCTAKVCTREKTETVGSGLHQFLV